MRLKINFRKLKRIKTFGISMYPLLLDGDTIVLKNIPFGRIKVNDIVAFKQSGVMLSHRVIFRTGKYLITKGDNNKSIDKKVYQADYIALATDIVRKGKEYNIESFYLLQSTYYFKEVIRIKSSLEKKKVNFVFLKGLPPHLFYEGEHPRRIYADCDVLIERSDFREVDGLLYRLGYRKVNSGLFGEKERGQSELSEISYSKLIHGFPVVLDVHLEAVFLMTQISNLDILYPTKKVKQLTEHFLNSKRFVNIYGHLFPILSEVDLILYLALHFFHHNYRGIYRLELIRRVIERSSIHRKTVQLASLINTYGLGNYTYLTFFLLKKLYDLKYVGDILCEIQINNTKLLKLARIFKKEWVFVSQTRGEAGVERFKLIYLLSPQNELLKILVFANLRVIYFAFSLIYSMVIRRVLKLFSKLDLI